MVKRMAALFICLMLAVPGALAAENATFFADNPDSVVFRTLSACGDALYIISDEDISVYREGEAAPTRVAGYMPGYAALDEADTLIPDAAFSPNWLFERDGALFGLCTDCALCGWVERGEALTLSRPVAIDWSALLPFESTNFYKVFLHGEALYCSIDGDDYSSRALLKIDPQTGAAEKLAGAAHRDVAPYQPGRLLLLVQPDSKEPARLLAYDIGSGATEAIYEFERADDYPSGLAYDAQADAAYWCLNGMLYALRPGEAPQAVNYMHGDTANLANATFWNGRYACSNYEGVHLRGVNPAQMPRRALRIEGISCDSQALNRFAARHPEVPVVYVHNHESDAVGDMVSGSAAVDIYCLATNGADYLAMRERGYLHDLSDDEVICAALAGLPENFARPLQKEGKWLAVPTYVMGEAGARWSYSPAVLSQLGLAPEDLPRTWSQLFQFIEAWPDAFGASFPDLSPFSETQRYNGRIAENLFLSFFDCYLGEYARSGRALSFDTPEFRDFLEALMRVRPDQYDFSEAERDSYDFAFSFGEDASYRYGGLLECTGDPFLSEYMGGDIIFSPLPLAVGASYEPILTASMYVMAINPYSKNIGLARQFLEEYCENLGGSLRLNLMAGDGEPLEDPSYAARRERIEGRIAEIEERLAVCAEAERQQYQADLKEEREMRTQLERDRYCITARDIARYRALQGDFCFDGAALFPAQDGDQLLALLHRFLEGALSADELISRLEQMASMMRMEGY